MLFLLFFFYLFSSSAIAGDLYYNTFEYADMRTVDAFGDPCLADGEQPNQGSGQCTNPQGHSSIWTGFITQSPRATSFNGAGCHSGDWCLKVDQVTTELHNNYLSDIGYGNGVGTWATPNVYARAFWKFPVGWTLPATCSGGKYIYLRDVDTQETCTVTAHQPWGTGATFLVECPNLNINCNLGSCVIPYDGNWHELEVHLDAPNQRVEIWLDNTKIMDQPTQNSIATNMRAGYLAFGLYDSPGPPETDCTPPQNQSFYIDDITVSTQRIGGGVTPRPRVTPFKGRGMDEIY